MQGWEPIDAGAIESDLESGEPDRVSAALSVLDLAWRAHRVVMLPLIRSDLLIHLGADLTEEIVSRFMSVVENHLVFEPPPQPAERHLVALDAALLYGPGQLIFDAALSVRIDENAHFAVRSIMRHLLDCDIDSTADIEAVEQLVDHLLDARNTRPAVVEGLIDWTFRGRYTELVDAALPTLDSSERERVLSVRDE